MENSDKTTYTMAEPSRDGCTIVQEVSLSAREYSLQKPGPDHIGTSHSCPVDEQEERLERHK